MSHHGFMETTSKMKEQEKGNFAMTAGITSQDGAYLPEFLLVFLKRLDSK